MVPGDTELAREVGRSIRAVVGSAVEVAGVEVVAGVVEVALLGVGERVGAGKTKMSWQGIVV